MSKTKMEKLNKQDQAKKWGQLVAACWADEALKDRFLASPAAVMAEFGMEVPAGKTIKAVANTAAELYVVLPEPQEDLTDDELDMVAGGVFPEHWA